jgi:hypothetical protein
MSHLPADAAIWESLTGPSRYGLIDLETSGTRWRSGSSERSQATHARGQGIAIAGDEAMTQLERMLRVLPLGRATLSHPWGRARRRSLLLSALVAITMVAASCGQPSQQDVAAQLPTPQLPLAVPTEPDVVDLAVGQAEGDGEGDESARATSVDASSIELGTWTPDGFAGLGMSFSDGERLLSIGPDDVVSWSGTLFIGRDESDPSWVLCGAIQESAPVAGGWALPLEVDAEIARSIEGELNGDPTEIPEEVYPGFLTVMSRGDVTVEGYAIPGEPVQVTAMRPATPQDRQQRLGLVIGAQPKRSDGRFDREANGLFARAAEARKEGGADPLAGVALTSSLRGGIHVVVNLADPTTVAAIVEALGDIPVAISSWGRPLQ